MTQGLSGYGPVQGGGQVGGGGLSGIFGGGSVGPNADPYNALLQQSAVASQGDNQLAAGGYQVPVPVYSNPGQAGTLNQIGGAQQGLQGAAGLIGQTAQGLGPAQAAAQAQFAAATGQGINANTAMARSATGGALAQNAAQLAAQGQNASQQGQAAAGSAQLQAQMAAQAQGQLPGVYNAEGGLAAQQMGLQQAQALAQQQAALDAAQQQAAGQEAFGNLGLGQQNSAISALSSYNQNLQAAQGNGNSAASNSQGVAGLIGGGAAGIASGLKSIGAFGS